MVINNQQINQETNSRICKIDIFHFDAYVRGCTLGFPSSRKQKKVNEERKMEIGRRERKREKREESATKEATRTFKTRTRHIAVAGGTIESLFVADPRSRV